MMTSPRAVWSISGRPRPSATLGRCGSRRGVTAHGAAFDRAMAVTAPDDEAPALFDQALGSEDAERWPFDRARVHLLLGERQRRMRAVTLVRAHLGAALNEFHRLGAPTARPRHCAPPDRSGSTRISTPTRS